ncbi:MAG: hypothetical protein R3A44_06655 [Caldilineaceae bacterium]
MEFQSLFPLLWLGVMGAVLAFTYLNAQSKREEIEQHLMRLGVSDIQIHFRFFDFDKTNYTYDVEYRDRAGHRQQTTCKVRGGLWFDNTLYWSNEPRFSGNGAVVSKPLMGGIHSGKSALPANAKANTRLQNISANAHLYAQSTDQKDQLISDLILENARLQQENQRLMK